VLRVHSGGGMLIEIQPISDLIQNELKPRFRTVGWISTAISAAAMTSHALEEIYFMSRGNYGACTGFAGSLDRPIEGRQLQSVLGMMEAISARGGWHPLIMRSMQIQDPVSVKITEDGSIYFFNDLTSGDFILNREKEILTLNAVTAEKIKFSKGTADTLDELTKLMGYQEIDWVGENVAGVPWPVSRAERMQMDFRKRTSEDETNTRRYFQEYQMQLQAAEQTPREQRAPFVGRARTTLERIKGMVRNNPAFRLTVFNVLTHPEFQEIMDREDKRLRDLLR